MGKKVLSFLLAFVIVAMFIPVLPVAAAEVGSPGPNPGNIATTGVTITVPADADGKQPLYLTEGIAVTDADLLEGVSAADETGTPVSVTVQDAGGLDMQNPAPKSAGFPPVPYIITYEAAHPVTGDVFTAARDCYVTAGIIAPTSAQPNVTFTANGGINLKYPANLVFTADAPSLLAGYAFDSLQFKNVTAGTGWSTQLYTSHGISYTNGALTIPAAVFGQHNSGKPLAAGTYIAAITVVNGTDSFEYFAEFKMTTVLDTSSNAQFTFDGNYADLAAVLLNNTEFDKTTINATSANLSGFGYSGGVLGLVEEGSVKVTLYKEFLQTLSGGTYKLAVRFKDGSVGELEFEIPQHPVAFDSGSDALHTFPGIYANLEDIFLNGAKLTQTPINGTSAYLSGYGSYNGNLGHAEAGSVKVTLYKAFLKTLPGGTYTLTVLFKDGSSGTLPFKILHTQTTSGSSSSSGKASTVAEDAWLEREEAQQLALKAKNRSEQDVRTIRKGTYGVRSDAWDRLAGLCYFHDTRVNGELQVRLYIYDPLKMKKDTLVSAYTADAWIEITKSKFEKHFTNKLRVVRFDQQADWDQSVRLAAKLDLTDMDTSNLYFYSYDKKMKKYRRIEKPAYRIDKNGYLHFTTPYAGDLIISENPLKKRS